MSEEAARKPLRCRLGLHRWSRDGAMFSSAVICDYCEKPAKPHDAARLALERELWAESAGVVGNDPDAQSQYVGAHLTGIGRQYVPERPG